MSAGKRGFLTYHGWQCERGFRQSDQACVAVEVPPDAYLDASGKDWKCERGFSKTGRDCVAVKIPSTLISTTPVTTGIAIGRCGAKKRFAWRRDRIDASFAGLGLLHLPRYRKNFMVFGGVFSPAFCI